MCFLQEINFTFKDTNRMQVKGQKNMCHINIKPKSLHDSTSIRKKNILQDKNYSQGQISIFYYDKKAYP